MLSRLAEPIRDATRHRLMAQLIPPAGRVAAMCAIALSGGKAYALEGESPEAATVERYCAEL